MEKKEINIRDKYSIIRALENAPEEIQSMEVGAFVSMLIKERDEQKESVKAENEKVCKEFKGTFLKLEKIKGIIGKKTEYIHIEDIEAGGLTDNYETVFYLSGKRISFSLLGANVNDLVSGDAGDSKTENQLRMAEVISEEEYQNALEKQKEIFDLTNSMI
jgi:hypothetical protein